MRAIICADLHFGYPGRLNDLVWSFNKMLDYCIINGINLIFILGDLSHDREHLSHDVNNAINDLFDRANDLNIQIVALVGNHDMFMRHKWKINAIRPFSKKIKCIDYIGCANIGGRKFWMVPFIEHEPAYMKIINDINDMADEEDVLLTHIGIASALMNACFLVQNWNKVSFEDTKFSRVYAGHFHCFQKISTKSWSPGSLIPFRFDEGLVEHGFLDYDIESNTHKFIDIFELNEKDNDEEIPPDFITTTSEDVESIIENCKNDYVKVQLSEEDNKDAIYDALKKAGASKIVFVKPKETNKSLLDTVERKNMSGDMFSDWLEYDNPANLNHKLLLELNNQIRADARMDEDD